jgi:hypothetical protein
MAFALRPDPLPRGFGPVMYGTTAPMCLSTGDIGPFTDVMVRERWRKCVYCGRSQWSPPDGGCVGCGAHLPHD